MSEREVTIKISATDNFSTVLNKYQTAVKGAGDATEKAGQNSKTAKQSFTDMANVVQGVFGAAIVQKAIQFGEELNRIGTEATRAETVFKQLAGQTGDWETALTRLRATTGGVVDDVTLMNSANKLMLSGLAANQDELNTVIELATKLGAAMGNDAASSIENFSLMLLNQSIPRLDSFGISGANVRQEINELIKTGQAANREEAFKMAVFEQGALALDKLGDSAQVAETSLAKFQTRAQNALTDLGKFVAQGVEGGATLLEGGAQVVDGMAQGNYRLDNVLGATVNAIVSEVTGQEISFVEVREEAAAAAESINSLADAQRRIQTVAIETNSVVQEQADILNRYTNVDALQAMDMVNDFAGSMEAANDAVRRQEIAVQRSGDAGLYKYNTVMGDFIESQERAAQAVDEQELAMRRHARSGGIQYQMMMGDFIESQERAAEAVREQQRVIDDAEFARQSMATFYGATDEFQNIYGGLDATTISGSGLTFFNPADVDALDSALNDVNARVEELAQLNEVGLISDEDLASAQRYARELSNMASDARDMAMAIEDLSLSELFGQTDGGQLGEAGSIIENLIGDTDVAGAFNDAIGLASGSETEISQAFDSNIAPLLAAVAEQQGADAATAYLDAYLERIRAGTMAGASPEQIAGMGAGALPYTLGAPTPMFDESGNVVGEEQTLLPNYIFPQQEGGTQTFGGLAGEGGLFQTLGIEDLIAGIGDAQTALEDMSQTEVTVDTSQAQGAVSELEAVLSQIASTAWSVTVDVKYNDPGPPPGVSGGTSGGSGSDPVRSGGDPRLPGRPIG